MIAQRAETASVIALAGRRIDALDADAVCFPLVAVPRVRRHLADLIERERTAVLVCAAACGADLIALAEAGSLGIRRRVVLPYAPERFRETSVTDRPGDWGPLFDRVIDEVRRAGDLVVLDLGEGAYAATNEAIVREAQVLCGTQASGTACRLIAVMVWEGAARPGSDITEQFRWLAATAKFEERIVRTD